jgi:hypothetical protein
MKTLRIITLISGLFLPLFVFSQTVQITGLIAAGASSTTSNTPPNTVDQSMTSYWQSSTGGRQWILISLPGSYVISEVDITWYSSNAAYIIDLQNNGASFSTTTYAGVTGTFPKLTQATITNATAANQVKISIDHYQNIDSNPIGIYDIKIYTTSTNFNIITTNKIGIGTSNPAYRLQIAGNTDGSDRTFLNLTNSDNSTNSSVGLTMNSGGSGNIGGISFSGMNYNVMSGFKDCFYIFSTGTGGLKLAATIGDINLCTYHDGANAPIPRLTILNTTGNILIGKSTQTNSTYKLEVEGKIRATEIVVNTTGADFVFEKNYKPRSLADLEQYVKINKHLPEIPSASEMQAKGVSLSDMQNALLQKVEELTLYMIELKKENDLLKQEINKLKN